MKIWKVTRTFIFLFVIAIFKRCEFIIFEKKCCKKTHWKFLFFYKKLFRLFMRCESIFFNNSVFSELNCKLAYFCFSWVENFKSKSSYFTHQNNLVANSDKVQEMVENSADISKKKSSCFNFWLCDLNFTKFLNVQRLKKSLMPWVNIQIW